MTWIERSLIGLACFAALEIALSIAGIPEMLEASKELDAQRQAAKNRWEEERRLAEERRQQQAKYQSWSDVFPAEYDLVGVDMETRLHAQKFLMHSLLEEIEIEHDNPNLIQTTKLLIKLRKEGELTFVSKCTGMIGNAEDAGIIENCEEVSTKGSFRYPYGDDDCVHFVRNRYHPSPKYKKTSTYVEFLPSEIGLSIDLFQRPLTVSNQSLDFKFGSVCLEDI